MDKRGTINFLTSQAVSPHVAHPLNTQLGNMRDTKVKTKHLVEKRLEKIIDFIWKLANPDY